MSRRSDEDDADAWLRFWLRFTAETDGARKHGVADLTSSAWRVLVHLATRPDQAEPIDLEALSEQCSISEASTSRALSDLEDVGYLTRRQSNRDGRLVERELTRAGRHALGKIVNAARSHR